MKLTQNTLRKIIREEISQTSLAPAIEDGGGHIEMFKQMLDAHCPGAWDQISKDEFHITAGDDEGLTVKVMRTGR